MAEGTSTQYGLIPAFVLSVVVLFAMAYAALGMLAGVLWLFHS